MTVQDERKALERLFVREPLLKELEVEAKRFNLFQTLKVGRKELVHSECLAYFLNPSANHGFGTAILDAFLGAITDNAPLDRLHFHLAITADAEISREWNFIDILIELPHEKIVVAVENKIDAEEHSEQLDRYSALLERSFRGWQIVKVFLTLEGARASYPRWQSISYTTVLQHLKRVAVLQLEKSAASGAVALLDQYIDNLERFIMPDNTIKQLCEKLYKKHKQAIDLLIENLPDERESIKALLQDLIVEAGFNTLSASNARIDFIPPEWRNIPGNLNTEGKKAVIYFYVELRKEGTSIFLYIGPFKDKELRKSLYDAAVSGGLTTNKHSPEWTRVWRRDLADFGAEDVDVQIREKWKTALAEILERVIPTFSGFPAKT